MKALGREIAFPECGFLQFLEGIASRAIRTRLALQRIDGELRRIRHTQVKGEISRALQREGRVVNGIRSEERRVGKECRL